MKKRKVWLTAEQVRRMFEIALERSKRDLLILSLFRYGLRSGEVTGAAGLPGVLVKDVRQHTVWVKGKGYAAGIVQDREVALPEDVMELLHAYIAIKDPEKRVIELSQVWVENLVKFYAMKAGVEDWTYVGPHRLRAFFATDAKEKGLDAFTIRDLMRHKNITTTNLYVGVSSTERQVKVVNQLAAKDPAS